MPPLSQPPLSGPHLDDEQLATLLAADSAGPTPSPALAKHLAACALCRDELASLRSSLAAFNTVSLAWAEQHAPARVPVPSRAALRWHGVPVWSTLAATVVAGAFLSAAHTRLHHLSPSPVTLSPGSTTPETADASPEEDDRLLLAVDREIRLGEQPAVSASELGLAQGTASRTGSVAN